MAASSGDIVDSVIVAPVPHNQTAKWRRMVGYVRRLLDWTQDARATVVVQRTVIWRSTHAALTSQLRGRCLRWEQIQTRGGFAQLSLRRNAPCPPPVREALTNSALPVWCMDAPTRTRSYALVRVAPAGHVPARSELNSAKDGFIRHSLSVDAEPAVA